MCWESGASYFSTVEIKLTIGWGCFQISLHMFPVELLVVAICQVEYLFSGSKHHVLKEVFQQHN